jgi:hypothetical protein
VSHEGQRLGFGSAQATAGPPRSLTKSRRLMCTHSPVEQARPPFASMSPTQDFGSRVLIHLDHAGRAQPRGLRPKAARGGETAVSLVLFAAVVLLAGAPVARAGNVPDDECGSGLSVHQTELDQQYARSHPTIVPGTPARATVALLRLCAAASSGR